MALWSSAPLPLNPLLECNHNCDASISPPPCFSSLVHHMGHTMPCQMCKSSLPAIQKYYCSQHTFPRYFVSFPKYRQTKCPPAGLRVAPDHIRGNNGRTNVQKNSRIKTPPPSRKKKNKKVAVSVCKALHHTPHVVCTCVTHSTFPSVMAPCEAHKGKSMMRTKVVSGGPLQPLFALRMAFPRRTTERCALLSAYSMPWPLHLG